MPGVAGMATLTPRPPALVQGWQQPIILPKPAAGSGTSWTVPGQYWIQPHVIYMQLQTSSATGNRSVVLTLEDTAGNVFGSWSMPGTTAPSLTEEYTWTAGIGVSMNPTSGSNQSGMAVIIAESGWIFRFTVNNIQAGDQILAANILGSAYPTDTTSQNLAG